MSVRTTIVMRKELLAAVRQEAAQHGWNLSQAIAELVKGGLHSRKLGGERRRSRSFKLPTFKGRLRPGVNLDDRDQLYELMDERR